MKAQPAYIKKVTMVAVFSALGVIIAPYSWFEFLGTRANPVQHMINAILGVLVGPLWASIAALIIGSVRIALGVGTIYAFPGGIPGALVVGSVCWFLRRFKKSEGIRLLSAFTEPIGTVFIGATLALYLVAPWIGTRSLLELIAWKGPLLAFSIFAVGWALSSIIGCILGFVGLSVLNRAGISREKIFD